MQYYRDHMEHGNDSAKANHFLIFGPWDHSRTRQPRQEFGGYKFGDEMMFDAFALDRAWYRWTMGGGRRPEFIKDRVTYFVAGGNEWKFALSQYVYDPLDTSKAERGVADDYIVDQGEVMLASVFSLRPSTSGATADKDQLAPVSGITGMC